MKLLWKDTRETRTVKCPLTCDLSDIQLSAVKEWENTCEKTFRRVVKEIHPSSTSILIRILIFSQTKEPSQTWKTLKKRFQMLYTFGLQLIKPFLRILKTVI